MIKSIPQIQCFLEQRPIANKMAITPAMKTIGAMNTMRFAQVILIIGKIIVVTAVIRVNAMVKNVITGVSKDLIACICLF